MCTHAKSLQSCPTPVRPSGLQQPTRLLCPRDSPGKNTGVGCHFLLQGVFLIQGLNQRLLRLPALSGGFFTTSATWEARIYVSIKYLFFSFSLTSLCVSGPGFIHFISTDSNAFIVYGWVILPCVYVPQFLLMAIQAASCPADSATMNPGVPVSFSTMVSSGYMPTRGTAGLRGSFILSLLRKPQAVLHSGHINLHSHQQCKRVPFLHTISNIYCL